MRPACAGCLASIAIALLPGRAWPAITATVLTYGSDTANRTSYVTDPITSVPETLILAWVATYRGSGAVEPPVLEGLGLSWVQVGTAVGGGLARLTLYRAMGTSAAVGSVTFTHAATQDHCYWSLIQFDNVDTSGNAGAGAVVQMAINQGGSGLTSLAVTLAPFARPENAAAGGVWMESTGCSPGSGFTELTESTDGVVDLQTEWRDSNDTTVDWSFAPSGAGVAGMAVEIRAGQAEDGGPTASDGGLDASADAGPDAGDQDAGPSDGGGGAGESPRLRLAVGCGCSAFPVFLEVLAACLWLMAVGRRRARGDRSKSAGPDQ